MSNAIARAVAERLNMQPSLIAPAYTERAMMDLGHLAKANVKDEKEAVLEQQASMLAGFGFSFDEPAQVRKPFAYANGLAFIPVTGMLINRFGYSWGSYVTGYNFIRTQMNAALADPDVEGIVFDVASYGGEVSGCFELSDDIYAARGQKPMTAVVDASCYSAAYAIASAADKIVATPTGGAGSIGVVTMHASYRKALEEAGVEVTYIFSGDHKVDGNPYQDLPDDVKAKIKADVDATRQKFVSLVARNRGLDAKVVYDTQAQTYSADDALKLGLIDAVAAPINAVSTFLNELSDSSDDNDLEPDDMDTNTPSAEKQGAQTGMTAEQMAAAIATAVANSRKADRERTAGVKALPGYAANAALADHLLLTTEMTVEQIGATLATCPAQPAAAAAAKPNPLDAAMAATPNPNISDTAASSGQQQGASLAEQTLVAFKAATGFDHTKHTVELLK